MIDTDKYEEYQNARVEGFIPAEWEFEDYLLAEIKRLREAIADVANSMEAADPSLLRSFIKDLLEVIE
tara:strand:- start:2258 stop:2461 length:204 start_codon:yes stop_codon:yes gene_type:complete